jgi:hypothetical protein
MEPLSEEKFQTILRNWRVLVLSPLGKIRDAEEEVLLSLTDQNQMERAILFMSAVIGRKGINMTNNTTNIGAAGVAISGGISSGNITGNLQQNVNPEVAKVLEAIEQLRHQLASSSELNDEQKADTELAVQDVNTELQKSPAERNPGRIRMAMNMLASSVKLVDGAQHLYESIAPHVTSILHHFL